MYKQNIIICINYQNMQQFDIVCDTPTLTQVSSKSIIYLIYLYKHRHIKLSISNILKFNNITKYMNILYAYKHTNYISIYYKSCNHKTNKYIINNTIICSSCIDCITHNLNYTISILC